MPWTPQFSAIFEEQIIVNTKALIVRDMKSALDHFYPSPLNLPDFKERALGQVIGAEFPFLAIGPRENRVEDTDDRSHVVEAARISLYVGVTDDSPENVTIKIMRYVRALDAVLRTGRQDFFTGMSNPFGVVVDVTHSYPGFIGANDSVYFRSATLELTVSLRER